MILWLLACPNTPPAPAPSPAHGLVLTTTDFSVGAIATVDVADRSVQDAIIATSGDPVVVSDGGYVVQLERASPASARVWAAPDFTTPVVELALPGGSNPQDAVICADRVYVTLLGEPSIAVFDRSGADLGRVDLAEDADADGNPEVATIVRVGERAFAGLQRLRAEGPVWEAAGDGLVVEIDCATQAIVERYTVGPNPSVHGLDDAQILVRTGVWGEPDGALSTLSIADGELAEVVSEADVGEDLGDLAAIGRTVVVLGGAFDFAHNTVRCLDLDSGASTIGDEPGNFLPAVATGPDGLAWVAQSIDYADADAPYGLRAFDATCVEHTDGPLPTLLPPYSIAQY